MPARNRLIVGGDGIVNTAKVILVVGAALVGSVIVSAADAQEAKQPPDIRMLLTQPQNRVSTGSAGVPDLRDVPMPKMDKPPVQPIITIVVGDQRCYPGEDGMGEITRFNRRPRRSQ
jgi:hypothetical protein